MPAISNNRIIEVKMRKLVGLIATIAWIFLQSGVAAEAQPAPAGAGAQIFESELPDLSKLTTDDIKAALQELINKSSQKLDTIQASITQQIDTVEKADAVYEQIDRTVDGVAEKLAPNSPFNLNMQNLREKALADVKRAAAHPDPETRKFAEKFQAQADDFEKIKSDAVAEYQKARNFLDTIHGKKDQIIFQIKLKAYSEAAKLARAYIAQAKDTLKAMQPLVPDTAGPQEKDKVTH
jgi:hypothetical protein